MEKRILILDDDQDILDVISYFLIDNGYEVQALSRGNQIFNVINEFNPNLILMDVMLAEMDGQVICKDIKEDKNTSHIPVILISGTHNLSHSLAKIGAPNDFIAKPFDIDHLLEKVREQLT